MSSSRRMQALTAEIVTTSQFDYSTLPISVRAEVQRETKAIKSLLKITADNIVQIGLHLQVVHDCIGREHFQEWLRKEFEFSQPVASNYMRVARVFSNEDRLERFQLSALYLLARNSVPSDIRETLLTLAKRGEFITRSRVRALLAEDSASNTTPEDHEIACINRLIEDVKILQKVVRNLSSAQIDVISDELLQFVHQLKAAKDCPLLTGESAAG